MLHHAGAIRVHQRGKASPETFLTVMTPYRDDLGVAVEGLFTWYWVADLGAREGIAFALGYALYRQSIYGGKAQNDRSAAQQMAVLRRGGMLPHAYV